MYQVPPCPGCGASNPPGRSFCRGCGAALAVNCPRCGAPLQPGSTSCWNCRADRRKRQRLPGQGGLSPSQVPYLVVLIVLIVGVIGVVYWQFVIPKDLGALTISYINVTSRGKTSATVTWQTNRPSSSQVEYGRSNAYGFSSPADIQDDPAINAGVTNHEVTLRGLQSGATYKFRVKSKDASGNEAVSIEDNSFRTQEQLSVLPDPGD
jgi:hypothetical protein